MSKYTPTASYNDRIKLPFYFDPDALLKDIQAMQLRPFIYYDVIPLRNPAHLIDSSRPMPAEVDDYADGSWTEWLNSSLLETAPNIAKIIEFFEQHSRITLVRLLRLEAGSHVKEHTDPTLGLQIERSVVRLTIPIQSEEQVVFYLNKTEVPMRPGECWYLRLTDPHSIEHRGQIERINMTIDLTPNEWLESQLNINNLSQTL
jgi:hypothetical protein